MLSTDRVYLRPLRVEDITPAYLHALTDLEVVQWTEARHIQWDDASLIDYVKRNNQPGVSQLLGIFLKDPDRHIGGIRLFNFSDSHRRAELSLMIFDRAQWSKGYATEALKAVATYAFDTLGLHRLVADYYAANTASARLFAKAGFVIEGVYRDHFRVNDRFMDSVRVGKLNPRESGASTTAPTQHFIPSAGPSITEHEVQLVARAARDGWYLNMIREIEEFERRFSEYTGMTYCLATNSCTAAIHLAMLGLRIGPGDDVIVPDITWVASAAPVCYVGATPVFVDINRMTWCLAPEAFERAITRRTKAVVAVGLLGNLPDMDAIRRIAARHRVAIIEDAAESIGATYRGRQAGTLGDIGVYSFNGTKLLVTGEGGMLATNDKALYRRCKGLAHHGLLMQGRRSKFYWSYELGYKYKMTNVQAALGLAQLDRIDELVEKRRQNFVWYAERLQGVEGIQLNQEGPHVRSTFWIVNAMVSPRYGLKKEAVVNQLVARRIGGRPFFYPISSMPPFAPYCRGKRMNRVNPVTYALSPYGVCLPSSANLTEAEVDEVCEQFTDILKKQIRSRGRKAVREASVPASTR